MRSRGLLISASAGSGKTTRLVKEFVRALLRGKSQDLSLLAAITFTEKAAEEMKRKVRRRLTRISRLFKARGEDIEDLMEKLGTARIGTIHGFCRSILREFSHAAGLDPLFEVMDDASSGLAVEALVDEIVTSIAFENEKYLDHVADLLTLGRIFGSRGNVIREFKSLLSGRRKETAAWIDRINLMPEKEVTEDIKRSLDEAWERPGREIGGIVLQIDSFIGGISIPEGGDKLALALLDIKGLCMSWAGKEPEDAKITAAEIINVITRIKNSGSKSSWGGDPAPVRDRLRSFRDSLDDHLDIINLRYDEKAAAYDASVMKSYCRIAALILSAYREYKMSRGLCDFDDLLTETLFLLENNPDIRKNVASGLNKIFVDEFQDTDQVQWRIIELVSSGSSLFLVGDEKQSIYAFRGADVRIFNRIKSGALGNGIQIAPPMDNNYRSSPAVIDFVNRLFRGIFAPAGTEYDIEYRDMIYRSRLGGGEVSINLFIDRKEDGAEAGTADSERSPEGAMIAEKIILLEKEGIKKRDMAVIYRGRGALKGIEEELRAAGIPFIVTNDSGFFEREEVSDLINLFEFLVFPSGSYALYSLLRSPAFSFPDHLIYRINNRGNLWESLLSAAKDTSDLSGSEREKVVFASSLLAKLLGMTGREAPVSIVRNFLEETGYYGIYLYGPRGRQNKANIDKFLNLLLSIEVYGGNNIYAFYDELKASASSFSDEGEAVVRAREADMVSLMTIHAAKGLEFDAVFVPCLDRKLPPSSGRMNFTADQGLGLKYRDEEFRENSVVSVKYALNSRLLSESRLKEEERILYVALTRAKKQLILSARLKEKAAERKVNKNQFYINRIAGILPEILDPEGSPEGGDYPKGYVLKVKYGSPPPLPAPAEIDIDAGVARLYSEMAVSPGEAAFPFLKPLKKDPGLIEFTPTTIMEYFYCPRKFFLKQIAGVPESSDEEPDYEDIGEETAGFPDPAKRGTLFHKILELSDLAGSPDEALIRKLTGKVMKGPGSEELYSAIFREVDGFYGAFRNTYPGADGIEKEKELYLKDESCLLRGKIDLMFSYGDSLIIIDYKTNRIEVSVDKTAERYFPQLRAYAHMARFFPGSAEKRVKTLLYLTRAGEFRECPGSPEETEKFSARLRQASSNIAQGVFPENPSACPRCGYAGICPLPAGGPRN